MDIRKLQETIVEALDDIKARDIMVFDSTGGSQEFDRVILATAEVARQTKAMALHVIDKVKAAGGRIVSMEGGDIGEWVLVDCVDAVVHIMQPAVRQYYNLEELWGQKRVRVQTAADKAKAKAVAAAKKAAEEAAALVERVKQAVAAKAAAAKAAAKKLAAKKAATKRPAAKKPAAKKPAGKKPAAKKPVAKKPAAKKPAAKKAAAKKPAAKKPAAKELAARKLAVKKPVAKKFAAKKPAARQSATRKAPAKKRA